MRVIIKTVQIYIIWNILMKYETESKVVTDNDYRLMPKVFHLDNFDDCMELGEKALYCSITVQLGPSDVQNKSKTWNIIQEVITDPRYYRHDRLRHGICIPLSCPVKDSNSTNKESLKSEISDCYSSKYENLGLKAVVSEMHCETNQRYYAIDNYDIGVGIALGILITIIIIASLYEGRARYRPKEEYDRIINTKVGRIVSCFSLPQNWTRLTTYTTNSDTNALKCLQGMRFYNLLLVILAHSGTCTFATSVENPKFIENLTRKPENILLINSLCVIQTFLVISGFLMSYNYFLIIGKGKKFQLPYIILSFINRYIRLTPGLVVMMALNSTWLYHAGRGPLWDKSMGVEYRNCRKNWWTNLLYINNYYDAENMCMQHGWYLATDTQLFVVSLIVIALMWKYQKCIKLILTVAVTIGFILPAAINYYNDYDSVIRMYPEAMYNIFLNVPQWHAMYSSSLVNFGAYALGLTTGYLFYKRRNTKTFTKRIYVVIWWVFSFGLPLSAVLYGLVIYQDDYQYTRIGAAIHVSVYRGLFCVGICLMLYGCADGIGWFVRDAVVWSPIQILGRLTYSIYLVHTTIIRARGGIARSSSYITHYTLVTQTCGDAAVSLIFGTLLALLVELPVSALQKLAVPQLADKRTPISVEERTENGEKGNAHHLSQRF